MKIITMMDLRRQPGERIIDVIRDKTKFLITKQGKPVAVLGPPKSDLTIIHSNGRIEGKIPLTFRQTTLGIFY